MGPQEIEFVILPDGTVKEEVRGMAGAGCEEVTRAIEDALGEVSEREHKPEYYQETQDTEHTHTRQS